MRATYDTREEICRDANQREGVLVTPHCRLSDEQVELIDGVSRELLEDPGCLCYNAAAAEIFRAAGATVEDAGGCVRVRLSSAIVDRRWTRLPRRSCSVPANPANRLILDAHEPRVRFGSGSETNIWLDVQFDGDRPTFTRSPARSSGWHVGPPVRAPGEPGFLHPQRQHPGPGDHGSATRTSTSSSPA